MHLLAAEPGVISDGTSAIDLGQSPGDIVVLSAADSEIACLAQAHRAALDPSRGLAPRLRLANILKLGHNLSVDLYLNSVIAPEAKLVIVRLLGGRGYWPYGVDQLAAFARERGIRLALLPGDDQPDAELAALSTIPAEALHRLWQYFVHGGVENAVNSAALRGVADRICAGCALARTGALAPRRALLAGSPEAIDFRSRKNLAGRCAARGDSFLSRTGSGGRYRAHRRAHHRIAQPGSQSGPDLLHQLEGWARRGHRFRTDRARQSRNHSECHRLCPKQSGRKHRALPMNRRSAPIVR